MPARDENRRSEYRAAAQFNESYQRGNSFNGVERIGEDKQKYLNHINESHQSVRQETLTEKKYLFRGLCTIILTTIVSGTYFYACAECDGGVSAKDGHKD